MEITLSEDNQNDDPSDDHQDDEQSKGGSDHEYEKWKAEHFDGIAQRIHDRNFEAQQNVGSAAINHANFALRTLVIINGGAAVAFLAFVGGLVSNEKTDFVARLAFITEPLASFAWGVFWATTAIAFAFFSTYCAAFKINSQYIKWTRPWIVDTPVAKRWRLFSNAFQFIAVVLAAISLYSFITGMLDAQEAIISAYPSKT